MKRQVRGTIVTTIRSVVVAGLAVTVATGGVAGLEHILGVPDASSVYLLAVCVVAIVLGRAAAVATAFLAFLAYDFLFIQPIYTFTVRDAGEWLNLTLLLIIGLLVGQLAALVRARAEEARGREREARVLVDVSRSLAVRSSLPEALERLVEQLRATAGLERTWITSTTADGRERQVADTSPGFAAPATRRHMLLRRADGRAGEHWALIAGPAGMDEHRRPRGLVLRVPLEANGRQLGNLWAAAPGREPPDPSVARFLVATADQIGQVMEQERLANASREAEIVRRSDALKTALLDSVSHDLRTPLASIRAAAGTLFDRTLAISDEDRFASAEAIDREAERLNQIVANLLDLSRIEAGALRADREVFDLADAVEMTLANCRTALGSRPLVVALEGPPPVLVDAVFLDRVIENLVRNIIRYTPPAAPVRICAEATEDGFVRMTIEDGGPGVPPGTIARLFDKFYRVPGRRATAGGGTGIGLSVVRGLVEAMGGRVAARESALGGLAIDLDLVAAPLPVSAPAGLAGLAGGAAR